MAKPIGLLLRGLRVDFSAVITASKVVVGVGALLLAGAWVGVLPPDMPLWLRVYAGASVAVPVLYFLTRPLVPPLPRVGDARCPRCSEAIHCTTQDLDA